MEKHRFSKHVHIIIKLLHKSYIYRNWWKNTHLFTSFSRAPALDFQGFHVIFKGPGLGFSRISRNFQGPRPWIFQDFTLFSRAPALDFQGFHIILKGPGLVFSRISRHFQGARPWIFNDFTSFSRAPALDFQGFHFIFKGPGLGFSMISCHFQGHKTSQNLWKKTDLLKIIT